MNNFQSSTNEAHRGPAFTTSGWQCPHCWSWVPSGQYHTCPNTSRSNMSPEATALNRIADALEGILAELRKRLT